MKKVISLASMVLVSMFSTACSTNYTGYDKINAGKAVIDAANTTAKVKKNCDVLQDGDCHSLNNLGKKLVFKGGNEVLGPQKPAKPQ